MERRVLLAISLSFLVLFAYQTYFAPPPAAPPPTAPVEAPAAAPATGSAATAPAPAPAGTNSDPGPTALPVEKGESAERDITVETGTVRAVFTNRGARLKHWFLKDYRNDAGDPLDLVPDPEGVNDALLPFSLRLEDQNLTSAANGWAVSDRHLRHHRRVEQSGDSHLCVGGRRRPLGEQDLHAAASGLHRLVHGDRGAERPVDQSPHRMGPGPRRRQRPCVHRQLSRAELFDAGPGVVQPRPISDAIAAGARYGRRTVALCGCRRSLLRGPGPERSSQPTAHPVRPHVVRRTAEERRRAARTLRCFRGALRGRSQRSALLRRAEGVRRASRGRHRGCPGHQLRDLLGPGSPAAPGAQVGAAVRWQLGLVDHHA